MSFWKKMSKKTRREFLMRLSAVLVSGVILEVVAFLSFAWFVNNKTVNANGMTVSAAGDVFDLSVSSELRENAINYYDSVLGNLGYDTNNTTGLSTDQGSYSIKWVMTDDTNNGVLAPGTYGSFSFYVTPHQVGELKIHFDISFDAYSGRFAYSGGKMVPSSYDANSVVSLETLKNNALNASPPQTALATKYENAMNYLDGHIMLFENRTNDLLYSNRIDIDTGFDRLFTVTDGTVDQPIEITIYWIWPNTISQIVDYNSSPDPTMFSSSQEQDNSGHTPKEEMFSYIISHQNRIFNSEVIGEISASELEDLLSLSNPDDIIILSNGYNHADQAIGESVRLVLFSLSAEEIIETE